MNNNSLFKLLCSIPVILVFLYFIPFLGICLMLFRCYIYIGRKNNLYSTLFICGILILLPKIIYNVFDLFNVDNNIINYLLQIIDSNIYIKLINYSKLLITVSIIFLIVSFIFNNIYSNLSNKLSNYIKEEQRKDYEISKANNLIIKEKQEAAKNTHVVYCPHCGADNIISGNYGTCKFCRNSIEYNEK